MDLTKPVCIVAVSITILIAVYMHDRAFRYDVVAAGAGSGGSQDNAGSTEVRAYIIDHQTGRVWFLNGPVWVAAPVGKVGSCEAIAKNFPGVSNCADSPLNQKSK